MGIFTRAPVAAFYQFEDRVNLKLDGDLPSRVVSTFRLVSGHTLALFPKGNSYIIVL